MKRRHDRLPVDLYEFPGVRGFVFLLLHLVVVLVGALGRRVVGAIRVAAVIVVIQLAFIGQQGSVSRSIF